MPYFIRLDHAPVEGPPAAHCPCGGHFLFGGAVMPSSLEPTTKTERLKLAVRIREQAREFAAQKSFFVMKELNDIFMDQDVNPKDRIKAAEILLGYGLGKPVNMVVSVDSDNSVERTEEFRNMVKSILTEAKTIDTTIVEGDEGEPPSTR